MIAARVFRLLAWLAGALLLALSPANAEKILIRGVTIVDVESGALRAGQSVLIADGMIRRVGPAAQVRAPTGAVTVEGEGRYLIPGLWDMHVHAHRENRWAYHYPLFRAYGVIGVRDVGSHLGSALAAMERVRTDPLAPRVIWGSPIVDGARPFNSHGFGAEDAASGRALVRQIKRLGFDFVKVYDRLTRETYFAIADEAKRQGIAVEGHVPLALTPADAARNGQRLIDHLTLVLEACTPGALEAVHAAVARAPEETDSLELMMDPAFAAALDRYDAAKCRMLYDLFASRGVWQVPTLVEMRGYFHADDPAITADPRTGLTSPVLLAEWHDWGKSADPARLANGRRVFAAQMRMIRPMHDAGVGLLAGTDASSEPWVFAGAGLHDELALLVQAGLTPAEALRTATLNPRRYQGRTSTKPLIAKGERADLVLLEGNPLSDIANTTRIAAVFTRGQYHDRAALDALLAQGQRAAVEGRR